jgi:serine/threonine-protein kinase
MGRDVDLGRDLAVEVLLEKHRDDPEAIRRFVEEAQIGGQLQHPGIVPVHELGRLPDGRLYIALKLVRGQTLAALLRARRGPSDDCPRLLAVFEQVCQAMAYAHTRGVVHRDLKPSNVMVGNFGEVQVMDWGLAKVLDPGGVADEARPHTGREDAGAVRTVRTGSEAGASRAGAVLGTPAIPLKVEE